jgi:hypothetical protein
MDCDGNSQGFRETPLWECGVKHLRALHDVVAKVWQVCSRRWKSARGLAHSRTLRVHGGGGFRASVLEYGPDPSGPLLMGYLDLSCHRSNYFIPRSRVAFGDALKLTKRRGRCAAGAKSLNGRNGHYLFFVSILAKRLSMLLKGRFTFPLGCRIWRK